MATYAFFISFYAFQCRHAPHSNNQAIPVVHGWRATGFHMRSDVLCLLLPAALALRQYQPLSLSSKPAYKYKKQLWHTAGYQAKTQRNWD